MSASSVVRKLYLSFLILFVALGAVFIVGHGVSMVHDELVTNQDFECFAKAVGVDLEAKDNLSSNEKFELAQLKYEESLWKDVPDDPPFDPKAFIAGKPQPKAKEVAANWRPKSFVTDPNSERVDKAGWKWKGKEIVEFPDCNIAILGFSSNWYYSERAWYQGSYSAPRGWYWLMSWLALIPALLLWLTAKWTRWLFKPAAVQS